MTVKNLKNNLILKNALTNKKSIDVSAPMPMAGVTRVLLRSVTFSCSRCCLGNPTKKGIFEGLGWGSVMLIQTTVTGAQRRLTGDGARRFLRLWL